MAAPPIKDAAVYSDLSGLVALKRGANTADPKALREVARQFESVFAKMMLTSMRQASSSVGDSLFGSDQAEFYQGMFDDQLSLELTKGKGLGLADMLVRQLQKVAGGAERGSDSSRALDSARSAAAKTAPAGAASAAKMAPTGAAASAAKMAPTSAGASAAKMAPTSAAASAAKMARLSAAGSAAEMTGFGAPTSAAKLASFSAAGSAAATKAALLGEPGGVAPSDSLDVATRFVQKMLSGNAAAANETATSANGARADASAVTQFRTPTSPEDFVQQLWPCAEAAGRELGIAPTHLIAQAALETGWGKSLPCDANGNPSFNFFGIKAGADWTGDTVATRTLEFQGGLPTPQVARFRAYDSAQDSFRDYVALLRDNPRYATALNTGNDAQAFATALQRGGYATDPAYARKIASIAQNLANSANGLKSSGATPIP
jgi:flagellar protein FlgJ